MLKRECWGVVLLPKYCIRTAMQLDDVNADKLGLKAYTIWWKHKKNKSKSVQTNRIRAEVNLLH